MYASVQLLSARRQNLFVCSPDSASWFLPPKQARSALGLMHAAALCCRGCILGDAGGFWC